jgi:DNA ligase (NAD+)
LSADQIAGVEGFGPITSPLISDALLRQGGALRELLSLGFVLEPTVSADNDESKGLLAGKSTVFTGAMRSGSRDEMQELARNLGAVVQSSVNGKTDILVAGERAGSKLTKAQAVGAKRGRPVDILSENEWLAMVAG